MIDVLRLLRSVLASLFKSRARLELEILVLRQQITVLRRKAPKRLRLTNLDHLAFVWLYRPSPAVIDAVTLLRPETLLGWHRKGFRAYWRWKSRSNGGRPRVCKDIRDLIHEISLANPLWGAPRIHGELLKLGLDVAQTTVAKYMARYRRPPSQGWKTFLRNHADCVDRSRYCADDQVPIALWARDPSAWSAAAAVDRRYRSTDRRMDRRQITEAFAWDNVPRYLVRERDGAYGDIFIQRLRVMGIRDHPIAPRSPWQNGYVERLIGSIRRECLDHVVVFGEQHLRRILKSYATYYNEVRTHLSLTKDAPIPRPSQGIGRVVSLPFLGGLHHRYVRV